MRRTFEYWFSVEFKSPENKDGLLILPKHFEQPIKRIRPLFFRINENGKSKFKQLGFQIGLGYIDYKNEEEYLQKRSEDAEKLRERNKQYIEECRITFENWKRVKKKGRIRKNAKDRKTAVK